MRYEATVGDEQVDCELDLESWPEVRAVVGGERIELRLQEFGRGSYWLTVGGRSIEACVVRTGDGYRVRIGGTTLPVSLNEGRRRLQQAHSGRTGSRRIRAPMPGRVVRLLVRDGDSVEAGQGLVVLEAMKMQNEMRSPCAGTVRSLSVEEGISVDSGDLLATVE